MKKEKKEEPEKKKGGLNIEITELFMAKAGKKDWTRRYMGTITREKDDKGNEISASGRISMDNRAELWSKAESQESMAENMDGIIEMVLDYNLHDDVGVSSMIAYNKFFHN